MPGSTARIVLRQHVSDDDVYAMALTAPDEPDVEVIAELRRAAADPDPGIRQSVVLATAYLGWPDAVALVEDLRRTDPADDIRHNAGITLTGLRKHGPGNSPLARSRRWPRRRRNA
jgi:hypothetical protein